MKHVEKCVQLKKEVALYLKHVAGWRQAETEKMSFADILTRAYVLGIPSLKPLITTLYSVYGEMSPEELPLLDAPVDGISEVLNAVQKVQYRENSRAYTAYFLNSERRAAAIAWKDGRVSVFVERTSINSPVFDTIQVLNDRLVTVQVVPSLHSVPRLTRILADEAPEFVS